MISLGKLRGAIVSTRLIAASLRNLSISSNSQPSISNPCLTGKIDANEFHFDSLIVRQNNSLVKDVGISCPLWRRKEIFEIPLTNKVIDSPTKIKKVIEDVIDENKAVILPDNTKNDDDTGKQAKDHMILIRRIKMNKHKLRKLRKKMKYEWAKVRQRREWKKEKSFTGELVGKIREAEKFSAENYVAEKIRQATEDPIPRTWKHRQMPQFLIKQKLEEEAQKKLNAKFKLWEEYGKQ